MERSFQLQEKKNSLTRPGGLKQSSDFKSPISVKKDSDNPFHSTILSMQKSYGNRYVQELVSGERTVCPELCGLSEPLVASPTRPAAQFKPHSCDSCIFHPQRSVKRAAVGASNPPGGIPLQAKLKIGQPGDKYEQEADRVVDMVLQRQCTTPEWEEEEKIRSVRISPLQISPLIQMQEEIKEEEKEEEEEEEEEEEKMLQMKQIAPEEEKKEPVRMKQTSGVIERDEDTTEQIFQHKGSGRPLEPEVREFMESRFGYDFGDVRVHTDSHAGRLSTQLGAEAFTVGRDVYFGTGRYSPASTGGKKLLGHELTHVVQQKYMVKKNCNHRNEGLISKIQAASEVIQLKSANKFIKLIDVVLSSVKDVGILLWLFASSTLKKKFPRLKNRSDFKFSAGSATATYNDKTKETFDVSGGAVKGYKTPKGHFRIHRKEGPKYISGRGDPMPHASYFYKGYAFHGCGGIAKYVCLDYPSHGCIHVRNSVMAKLHPYIKLKQTKVEIK